MTPSNRTAEGRRLLRDGLHRDNPAYADTQIAHERTDKLCRIVWASEGMEVQGGDTAKCVSWLLNNAEWLLAQAERVERLEAALRPFAKLADTWTVETGYLLTLSNGERMCGIEADAFKRARTALASANIPPISLQVGRDVERNEEDDAAVGG